MIERGDIGIEVVLRAVVDAEWYSLENLADRVMLGD
jgi:hypothetical protein